MTIQVSITGEPGCGKTTVAQLLAQKLGANYLSTGSIQRAIALSLGITTLELNQRAETDTTIDQQIDAHTQALADSAQTIVVDSRLAWRFLPGSLKVFLVCPPEIAADRVHIQNRAQESYASKEQAFAALISRYHSEKARFEKYYGATLSNLRNYDLVIDTSAASPEAIASEIARIAQLDSAIPPATLPLLLLSPTSLIPTKLMSALELASLPIAKDSTLPVAGNNPTPITVCRVAGAWLIATGHQQVALALKHQREFLPARLAAQEHEALTRGVTAYSLLQQKVDWQRVEAWEKGLQFTFKSYPAALQKNQRVS